MDPSQNLAVRIGVVVVLEVRGPRIGLRAQTGLVEGLVAISGADLVEADTRIVNVAEQPISKGRTLFAREAFEERRGAWHLGSRRH